MLSALGLRRVAPPDGEFNNYADIGHLNNDSLAFCKIAAARYRRCHRAGFGFRSSREHRFMRFSFAVSTDLVTLALERLRPWFRDYQ